MILWLLVLLLMGAAIAAGYYQGAVRALFSLLGLLLGSLLSVPMTGLGGSILGIAKVQHPILINFLGPMVPLLVIFLVFFGAGFFAHKKIHMFFKYRSDDETFFRWERVNKQLGICLGILNGTALVFLICIGFYVLGYFTVQVESEGKDPWYLSLVNSVAKDIDDTGFSRSLAPFVPASATYFMASDVLGFLYHNPDLKDRLSRYPLFLPLAEESRFQELGGNETFQNFWKAKPSLVEFSTQNQVEPLASDAQFYANMHKLLDGHFQDLMAFLRTGESPMYADQQIVDRWLFNLGASWKHSSKVKSNMTVAEKKWLLSVYQALWKDSSLTAFLDNSVLLKNKGRTGGSQTLKGKWEHAYAGKYTLRVIEEGQWNEFDALVESNRLTLSLETLSLVFDR